MLLEDINKNRELESKVAGNKPYKILIIGNIIVNQIKDLIEIPLRENNINASVTFGDYNNFAQASINAKEYNAVIVFWEACNLVNGFHYKCNTWSNSEINDFIKNVKAEILLTINHLSEVPLVVFNSFDTSLFNFERSRENIFDDVCSQLNSYLNEVKTKNIVVLNLSKVILSVGVQHSFNKRMWHSSSMLYSYEFLKKYASKATGYMLSLSGKAKKAIVLDCDNTLWKGIIGEDGPNGIAYNKSKKDGEHFEEIQYMLKELAQQGVLLALNSKNNENDVKAVFTENNDIVLKWDDFLVTKVNWNDKVTNLKEIAKELNIGIDSLVHLDDSNFEINHIKSQLPEVTTIQVPENLKNYSAHFISHLDLFLNLNRTKEDANRVEMYKIEKSRHEVQNSFKTITEYLQSLELEVNLKVNDKNSIDRIAQMTQKTNQFNLTTPRYTEAEIDNFIASNNYDVFSFGLKDKFGDYGITGLCILEYQTHEIANIDTFLMSCRIIGRNVELAFLNFLISFLTQRNIKILKAKYIKTFKNDQVENLFDNFGFKITQTGNGTKDYIIDIEQLKLNEINYIKINYEG
jgi:FkbH-like protein